MILILSHCFAIILLTTGYKSVLQSFERFSPATLFYLLFIIVAPLFTWYYLLDNRYKLAINSEGISTSRGDSYQWSHIEEIYIKEVVQPTKKYFLVLGLRYNQGEKTELDISFLDRKPEDIALIVETLTTKHSP